MKKLTLILSLMIALVGLNANAAIYLVGNEPLGNGWDPSTGVEMNDNGDGTYSFVANINGDVWFCFADGLNSSWDVFNGTHRYGPSTGVDQVITAETWTTTQKQGNGNGSYQFHGSGEDYTVIFDLTNMQFKIEGYVAPTVYESFTVAGEPASVFGTEWDVENNDNDMTLDATDGLYKLVKENVEINAGTIYFKVAANHAWGESWGNGNQNQDYYFNQNGTYNLTFNFNFDTKEVWLDAELVTEGPEIDPYTGKLYMVGQVNDNAWNPSTGIQMTNVGDDDTFTLANAQIIDSGDGYGYFSFMSVLGESAESWPANGYRIGAAENATLAVIGQNALGGFGTTGAFKLEPGYYNFSVVLSGGENGMLTITAGEAPEPVVDDVYIFGDVNNFSTAEGWDPTKGAQMTLADSVYTATVTATKREGQELAYLGFTKKIADAESEDPWGDIAAYRFGPVSEGDFLMTEELLGAECDLATDGSYNAIAIPDGEWTITVNLNTNKFTVNGTWPVDTVIPEPETNVYIIGDVNNIGWSATQGVQMTLNEGIYTAEITTQNQGDLGVGYFGFTTMLADPESETDVWTQIEPYRFGADSEGAFVMTEELLNAECALATDGSYNSIAIPEGTWTVTVDLVNHKFTVNGTWPTQPEEHYTGDVYIIGEVNDNGGWFTNKGVKMTFDAENYLFTADVTTTGEAYVDPETNIGYSYFSFTKQLADSAADWDAIAPYRFGAANSEGNYWVTDETLGIEIGLANSGATFQIPAGEWKFTLSVDNMTLKIEKNEPSFIRGDINGDTQVNIADVTALISRILSKAEYTAVNDCNNDGVVNIADVTALISRVLAGVWKD